MNEESERKVESQRDVKNADKTLFQCQSFCLIWAARTIRPSGEIKLALNRKNLGAQVASTDKISSSAHQRGDSLGVAWSGDMAITSLNLPVISLIEGLCLRSGLMQSMMISQMMSSSLFLKFLRVGSMRQPVLFLSYKYWEACQIYWSYYYSEKQCAFMFGQKVQIQLDH